MYFQNKDFSHTNYHHLGLSLQAMHTLNSQFDHLALSYSLNSFFFRSSPNAFCYYAFHILFHSLLFSISRVLCYVLPFSCISLSLTFAAVAFSSSASESSSPRVCISLCLSFCSSLRYSSCLSCARSI